MARTCRRTRFRYSRRSTRSNWRWWRPPGWCATWRPIAPGCARPPRAAFRPRPISPIGSSESPACRSARRITRRDGSSRGPNVSAARWLQTAARRHAGDRARGHGGRLRRARRRALDRQPRQSRRYRTRSGAGRDRRGAAKVPVISRAVPSLRLPLARLACAGARRVRQEERPGGAARRAQHLSPTLSP